MDNREIRSTLVTKLGAAEDRTGHHIYFWLNVAGSEFRVGKLSHNARGQAPDYVISDTAKRLKLTKKEFNSLVECTIDKQMHGDIWRKRRVQ
jgi:hypothetical protein